VAKGGGTVRRSRVHPTRKVIGQYFPGESVGTKGGRDRELGRILFVGLP